VTGSKRGPAPKPTKLKVIEGRKGAKAQEAREPVVPPAKASAQPWMRLNAAERKLYDRARRELLTLGMLGSIDDAMLAVWAKAYHAAETAFADVSKRGQIVAGRTTKAERVTNRSVAIARDMARLASTIAQQYGMTPSGRVGIRSDGLPAAPGSLGELLGDGG
jgi:phage terminase small subunit